jgi:dipeptidyl aminopeptidase/acylaminoacyl peptidase
MRTLLLFLLTTLPLHAQERTHVITPGDYASVAMVTSVALSPDGQMAAYSEARWQLSTDDRKADLWLIPTAGGTTPSRLTFDRSNGRAMKWSSNGRSLYYLANRKREGEKKPPYDGSTQVWRYNRLAQGEHQPVTSIEGGITGYDLAGNALFYSVDTSETDSDDFSKLRATHGKLEYGHGRRATSQIWKLDLVTWRAEKLVDDNRYVREFVASPDGKRLGFVSAHDDSVLKSEGESRVDIWEAGKITTPATEPYRAKAHSPHAWLEHLAWSHDGKKLAFNAIFDGHPTEIVILTQSEGGWNTALMERPSELHVNGYGSLLKWHPKGDLFFIAEMQGRSFVVKNDQHVLKNISSDKLPDRVLYGFDLNDTGTIAAYIMGTSKDMGELYVTEMQPGKDFRKLVEANPQAKKWMMPSVGHISWVGKDGANCGGILELPYDYKPGTKLPLIVAMHGGPTTSSKAALEFDPHNGKLYFSARGYAVLLPNYRGSTGYGDHFLTDLLGKENDVEVNDIIAGVEHLIKEGIADGDRVGVMGWSNGGYLTNCFITKKNLPFKLKAASSGAGILDCVMEWGSNDEPAYPKVLKKGHPWEVPEIYKNTSPTYGLANVTTPTLIHVGGNDVRCPPSHSRMLYRALKEYIKVPTELVVYPGEPHGLTKYSNRLAKMEWDLAWFDKYLKGK